jgi:hypothetical protein
MSEVSRRATGRSGVPEGYLFIPIGWDLIDAKADMQRRDIRGGTCVVYLQPRTEQILIEKFESVGSER